MVGALAAEGSVVQQLEALGGDSPLTLATLRRLRRTVPTWYDMVPATREAHRILESKLLALAEGGEAEGGEVAKTTVRALVALSRRDEGGQADQRAAMLCRITAQCVTRFPSRCGTGASVAAATALSRAAAGVSAAEDRGQAVRRALRAARCAERLLRVLPRAPVVSCALSCATAVLRMMEAVAGDAAAWAAPTMCLRRSALCGLAACEQRLAAAVVSAVRLLSLSESSDTVLGAAASVVDAACQAWVPPPTCAHAGARACPCARNRPCWPCSSLHSARVALPLALVALRGDGARICGAIDTRLAAHCACRRAVEATEGGTSPQRRLAPRGGGLGGAAPCLCRAVAQPTTARSGHPHAPPLWPSRCFAHAAGHAERLGAAAARRSRGGASVPPAAPQAIGCGGCAHCPLCGTAAAAARAQDVQRCRNDAQAQVAARPQAGARLWEAPSELCLCGLVRPHVFDAEPDPALDRPSPPTLLLGPMPAEPGACRTRKRGRDDAGDAPLKADSPGDGDAPAKRRAARPEPPWSALPDDCWLAVMEHLSARSLCRVAPVCTEWRFHANGDALWRALFARRWPKQAERIARAPEGAVAEPFFALYRRRHRAEIRFRKRARRGLFARVCPAVGCAQVVCSAEKWAVRDAPRAQGARDAWCTACSRQPQPGGQCHKGKHRRDGGHA